MLNRTIFAALALTVVSTAAIAQSAEEQQACMNDAFRVCSATIPDRARTTACMIQNKSQLSAACQMVMDKYSPAQNQTQTASAAPSRTITTAPARMTQPIKTAANTARPGKPLNILMR